MVGWMRATCAMTRAPALACKEMLGYACRPSGLRNTAEPSEEVYDEEPWCPLCACQEHKPRLPAVGDHGALAAASPGAGEARKGAQPELPRAVPALPYATARCCPEPVTANAPAIAATAARCQRCRAKREWLSLTFLSGHQAGSAPAPLWADPHPSQPAIGMSFVPGKPFSEASDQREPLRALAGVRYAAMLGIEVTQARAELTEVQSLDVATVAARKAADAYGQLREPALVDDTGLAAHAWNGLPGALVAWFIDTVGRRASWTWPRESPTAVRPSAPRSATPTPTPTQSRYSPEPWTAPSPPNRAARPASARPHLHPGQRQRPAHLRADDQR